MAHLNDAALEEYYNAFFVMHSTEGWQKLMEDFGRMIEVHSSLNGVDTAEQLWFRKGQLDIMRLVFNHRSTIEYVYNGLLAEQDGKEPVQPSDGVAKVIS